MSLGPHPLTILPGWITNEFPNEFVPVIFAAMITELKSEKIISCNFLEVSIVSFCHSQKRSSHLVSQNSSPHARHVLLDEMSVTIKVLEPDQNAAISKGFF